MMVGNLNTWRSHWCWCHSLKIDWEPCIRDLKCATSLQLGQGSRISVWFLDLNIRICDSEHLFPRIINGLWTDVSTSLFERNSTLHIKTLGRSWTNACSKSPGSNYEIMLNMYNEHRFVFTWLAARALIPNFWQSWWCCCSITDSGHMTVTVDP